MKTKTPLIIALSSGLTLALVLTSTTLLELLRDRDKSSSRPEDITTGVTPIVQPVQPSPSPVQPAPSRSQAENDYLYDLSQALQPQERNRTSETEKLAIGQQIRTWLDGGADYWGIRKKFDEIYKGTVLDNYAHNRDVYIKFATERFASSHLDTLVPPPQVIRVPVPSGNSNSGSNSGSGSGNTFTGGNPIPQKAAVVISKDELNCRATPSSGAPVAKLQPQEAIEVNRVDYSTGKAWYLTTQGCWVSGNYIQIGGNAGTNPIPAGFRETYIVAPFGFYKDAPDPTAADTTPYKQGDKIIISKYPTPGGGMDWYSTPDYQHWINGNDIKL